MSQPLYADEQAQRHGLLNGSALMTWDSLRQGTVTDQLEYLAKEVPNLRETVAAQQAQIDMLMQRIAKLERNQRS